MKGKSIRTIQRDFNEKLVGLRGGLHFVSLCNYID